MKDNQQHWSVVIKPKTGFFEINYRELWDYRDLVYLLVKRDFISFYKQTIFGPLWFLIQPLFTTLIYVFVFGRLAGLSTDGLPPALFYMTNIIAWNYFAECINKTSTVFKDNANVFGKVYFPRLIMPVSIVISNLVKFGVQFGLLLIAIAYFVLFRGYEVNFTWYILIYPLMVLLLAAIGLGGGMIISAMTTKYRDLSFLVAFGVQLFMYVTPIIYPVSAASEKVKDIAMMNPLSPIIEGMRLGLLGQGEFTTGGMIYAVVTVLVILFSGIFIFNKVEKSFVDTV